MKTKKLIELLQQEDPSGEIEVCVGNVDIFFVERLPAYYDGSLQVLERDESLNGYNIIGGKYVRSGHKVVINTLSITDAISNCGSAGGFKVDYSDLNEISAESTKKAHDELISWHKDMEIRLEKSHFVNWAKKEAAKLTADVEDIESMAGYFFDEEKIDRNAPLIEGHINKSYVERREMEWSKKYRVNIDNGFLKIGKN